VGKQLILAKTNPYNITMSCVMTRRYNKQLNQILEKEFWGGNESHFEGKVKDM